MNFPRWLIDDTAGIGDARVFIAHTIKPRFVGELLPVDEGPIDGITFPAPMGQVVCNIAWHDEPIFDSQELLGSMAKAILHHDSVRGA
jgi:hypothetical protein